MTVPLITWHSAMQMQGKSNHYSEVVSWRRSQPQMQSTGYHKKKTCRTTAFFKCGWCYFKELLLIYFNIFEKLLCSQQAEFLGNILSKLDCGFNKGNGTQPCPLLLIKIWKGATEKSKNIWSIINPINKMFAYAMIG